MASLLREEDEEEEEAGSGSTSCSSPPLPVLAKHRSSSSGMLHALFPPSRSNSSSGSIGETGEDGARPSAGVPRSTSASTSTSTPTGTSAAAAYPEDTSRSSSISSKQIDSKGLVGNWDGKAGGWEKVYHSDGAKWHTEQAGDHDGPLQMKKNPSMAESMGSIHSSESGSDASNAFNISRAADDLALKAEWADISGDSPEMARETFRVRRANSVPCSGWKPDLALHWAEEDKHLRNSQVSRDLSQFAMRRDGKLLLAMIGLPARGKSYIAQGIAKHLNWLGIKTRIFNAGNYRREVCGPEAPASFFDPDNEEGKMLRERCALLALGDAIKYLKSDEGYVAIFDATNTTKKRRTWLRKLVAQSQGLGHRSLKRMSLGAVDEKIQLTFIESVCEDDELIWKNVKNAKLNSPDYAGWEPDAVMRDFFQRIEQYKRIYQMVEEEEGSPFIRLENTGERLVVFRSHGYISGRIVQLLSHTQLELRGIILTRPGENVSTSQGRMGNDSPLTLMGERYAEKFAASMKMIMEMQEFHGRRPTIWSASSTSARQFCANLADLGLEIVQLPALNDLSFGIAEGMTYPEFAQRYPSEYRARLEDKLNYVFPKGESYDMLFRRIEAVLLELTAESDPVVVVAHLPVLRIILGYLTGKSPEESVQLEIPLNCAICLFPCGYTYTETRFIPVS